MALSSPINPVGILQLQVKSITYSPENHFRSEKPIPIGRWHSCCFYLDREYFNA